MVPSPTLIDIKQSRVIIDNFFKTGNLSVLEELQSLPVIDGKYFVEHEAIKELSLNDLLGIVDLTRRWEKKLGHADFLINVRLKVIMTRKLNESSSVRHLNFVEEMISYPMSSKTKIQLKALVQLRSIGYSFLEIFKLGYVVPTYSD